MRLVQKERIRADFIEEKRIYDVLEKGKNCDRKEILDIIEKARLAKGLTPEECAILIQVEDQDLLTTIFQVAREIKVKIYDVKIHILFVRLCWKIHKTKLKF